MKVYKIEVMVIDFDGIGGESIKDVIENTRYPNHCISPSVMDFQQAEIGVWDDSNPLNNKYTLRSEYKRLFS